METATLSDTASNLTPRAATGKMLVGIGGHSDYAHSVALQADGKILLAGYSFNTSTRNTEFAVVRLNADGTLDSSFGGDGKATFDIGAGYDQAYSLALQSDGRILVSGYSHDPGADTDFSVIRLNPDGSLDTGFGDDGKATFDLGGGSESSRGSTVQPDGKILLLGYSVYFYDFGVLRLNTDGTLDTGFGTEGKATFHTEESSYGYDLTLQPDGKILMAGSGFNVIRLNADGTLDTGFGDDGKAAFDIALTDTSRSLALQPDGKILVAGSSYYDGDSHYDFSLIRLNADGSLDHGFGGDGEVTIDILESSDMSYGMALQPDGKILVAGQSYNPNSHDDDFSVIRLNADGSLDTSFGGDGKATFNVGGDHDAGQRLILQPDGKILIAGYSYNISSNDFEFSVIRLNADGSLDKNFGALDDGVVIFTGTDDSDKLTGSDAPELILGKGDEDRLEGGAGDDILDGGAGRDVLSGGTGADLFRVSAREDSQRTASEGFADRILDFEAGTDRIDLSALGFSGLGDGHDGSLAVQANDAGTLTYLKSFEVDAEGRRFEIVLEGDYGSLLGSGNLIFAPLTLEGTEAGDSLTGSPVAENLAGASGDDRLHGAGGDDLLDGGAGRDRLTGGSGADLFRIVVREDSYRTASENFADRIRDFDPDEDRLDLSALGFTALGDGHDGTLAVRVNEAGTRTYLKSFEADAEGRRFELALDGDLAGRLDGGNLLFAAAPLEGSAADDDLIGSAAAEILTGADGDDYLHGGAGDDILDGGAGRDTLAGGSGADLFRFSVREDSQRTAGEGFVDRILDFEAGTDRIDLSALGFGGLGDGRDGTLAVQVNGERTYLKSFEADGEGRRFEVALEGDLGDQLSAGDFLFAAAAASADRLEVLGVTQPEQAA
ncbi:M10 family metallopeptidase C-terminal domain-containing protein [Azotobacter vinelandii]